MSAWLRWGCAVLLTAGCKDPVADGGTGTTGTTGGTDVGDTTTGDDSGGDDESSDDGGALDPSAVPEPLAGRLTDVQYGYTVLDVLGVELTSAERDALPADIPSGRDYSTTVDPQFFNAGYVMAYAEIARSVTARLDPLALVSEFGGCAALDDACWPDYIEALGRRLYRRPLTEAEQGRYLALTVAIAEEPNITPDDVARGVAQAMLQAPQFLYRIEDEIAGEPGQLRTVDGYELATRLSYFLWLSAPDDELLAFAAGPQGDGVFDPQQLPQQVERMIADPKFTRARETFWGDYTMAARSSFGTSDTQLADELRDSLLATLERMSGAQGAPEPLSALFDGRELVMTPTVAELAGATPTAAGLGLYDVGDLQKRLGVVTHPAFLASIGTTSFVGRGLFLTERLLCQHVTEPPDEVAEQIETTAQATEEMTPREASEFRMGIEPVCMGCHTQFEPVAYAFERYDMAGRYSLVDEQGRALYADGTLPGFGGRDPIAFEDAQDLLAALAQTQTIRECLVENMSEFAMGQRPPVGEFSELTTADFIDDGLTFDALARAVAQSEQRTLTRVVEP